MTYRWDIDGQEWTDDPERGDGPELDGCVVSIMDDDDFDSGVIVGGPDDHGSVLVDVGSILYRRVYSLHSVRPVGWRAMMADEDAGIDAWERENPGTGP